MTDPWDRYIYLHGRWIFMGFHVGKYTSHMDPTGICKVFNKNNLLNFSKTKNPRQFELPSSQITQNIPEQKQHPNEAQLAVSKGLFLVRGLQIDT